MSKTEKQPAPAPAPATKPAGPQTLLTVGVILILLALAAIIWLIASGRGQGFGDATNNSAAAPGPAMPERGRLLPSGLRFESIREGTGARPTAADTVLLRYELRVVGRAGVIESNFSEPQPTPMALAGTVPGFTEGVSLIRVGGEGRFWVPPQLGYGAEPRPGAPFGPNDVLEFRVRVEGIQPAGTVQGDIPLEASPAPAGNSSNEAGPATETPAGR